MCEEVTVRVTLCRPAFSSFQTLKCSPTSFFSFKGNKVDTNRLQAVLKNLGIELNPYQHSSLLNMLPVDGKCHGYHRGLLVSLVLCLCKEIPKDTKNV